MSRSISVLQHHPAEGVGELVVWAEQHDIALQIYRSDLGQLPASDGAPCVLLGGPCSVITAPPWLRREQAWLGERIADDTPLLGICLGAQLLAHALGARIYRLERPETGWCRIDFSGGASLDVLQWHEDTFDLPPGARQLASSAACAQQMFSHGPRRIGLQFHAEWNPSQLAQINAHFGDDSPLPRKIDQVRHARATRWLHQQLDQWIDA